MNLKQKLISDAENFCTEQGISLSRLSTIVVNGGGFFKKLEEGKGCSIDTYETFQKVFSDEEAWAEARRIEKERRKKVLMQCH
ncbi:hypothetical protein [Kiloniella antarctica]|uniref:Uncharacterized protein n=1 Tax=Kiloniella antarctica TaxID=1550907 RepID=A0ABW5BM12_9PROT